MKDGPRFNYENSRWASNIEALRDKYRPVPVKTMFVGESPPANGEFFYADKNTGLRRAFEGVLTAHGMAGDARDRMKEVGWYLYDLVQYPVKKEALERASEAGVPGLAKRIEEYEPEAIVSSQV